MLLYPSSRTCGTQVARESLEMGKRRCNTAEAAVFDKELKEVDVQEVSASLLGGRAVHYALYV